MSRFYPRLAERYQHDTELTACVERIVNQLENVATTGDRPGMLLGKIQSGKTRAFIGVIAYAFDRGFDIALVLTKGTKTLSTQTVARLRKDFSDFIEDDEILVLDIMKLPGKLRRSELNRKIVVVAKKQSHNLTNLIDFMDKQDALKNRRVLLIDDEADLASIRFTSKPGDAAVIEQGKLAEKIDDLRRKTEGVAFLQVTATPYSLYLQPEGYEAATGGGNYIFKPKKPAFTELLPIHSGYVGGDDFFGDHAEDDPRSYLTVIVDPQEQDALRRPDQRRIRADRVLESPNLIGLRRSIVTFILAACMRRWQQQENGERKRKYTMVIHNDIQKSAHAWQDQVLDWIFEAILEAAKDPETLRLLFDDAFEDLMASVLADKGRVPSRDDAFNLFIDALQSDEVVRETVNSDKDVLALLDDKGELNLRTPFNIYVGGNILDRGLTIPNLIAFYYGRNPRTMQADTVLQHSRMYGARDRRDLAVTRFYTSQGVYDRLCTINTLENTLREAFETGAHDRGVIFIQKDATQRVRPCAPNKLMMSDVVAVKANGLLVPTGFQTKSGKTMMGVQTVLEGLIKPEWRDTGDFIQIDRESALEIINVIKQSMVFDDMEFEWDAMCGLIDYYSDIREGGDGTLLLWVETGRRLDREKSGDKSGLSILGTALRAHVIDTPRSKSALILLQQEGTINLNWSGHRFWWPILAVPGDVEPCVFAMKAAA